MSEWSSDVCSSDLFTDLMTLHGLPMGIFSGDEDLHGNAPTQGIELCSITESMFSLEKIIAVTGDVRYMDALERMTFNALPTQTTDDYNMKQYFQVANQVQRSEEHTSELQSLLRISYAVFCLKK